MLAKCWSLCGDTLASSWDTIVKRIVFILSSHMVIYSILLPAFGFVILALNEPCAFDHDY